MEHADAMDRPQSRPAPDDYPAAAWHLYQMNSPRACVPLYTGVITVTAGPNRNDVDGAVAMILNPSPRVVWQARGNIDLFANGVNIRDALNPNVSFTGGAVPPVPTDHGNWTFSSPPKREISSDGEFTWKAGSHLDRHEFADSDSVEMYQISFFVLNLPVTANAGFIRTENGDVRPARVTVKGGGWSINLDAVGDRRILEEDLDFNGGYAITHIGQLCREDGSGFQRGEARDVLHLLRYVMSFAAGRWVSPCLPVGYDSSGKAVWCEWSSPLVRDWGSHRGTADWYQLDHLSRLFAAVEPVWWDELKRDIFCRSVYYLIDANDPQPMEIAVSSGQAGLELLAWVELVEETQAYSPRVYRNRRAEENIRELLGRKRIEVAIPATLVAMPGITKIMTDIKIGDGPEVLTRMRNGVMHPSRTKPRFSLDQWRDSWHLVRHYLQLAILAYVKYDGTHVDPIWYVRVPGQVEQVPWG